MGRGKGNPGFHASRAVADWWSLTGEAPNALVVTEIDTDGLYALLTESLARL